MNQGSEQKRYWQEYRGWSDNAKIYCLVALLAVNLPVWITKNEAGAQSKSLNLRWIYVAVNYCLAPTIWKLARPVNGCGPSQQ